MSSVGHRAEMLKNRSLPRTNYILLILPASLPEEQPVQTAGRQTTKAALHRKPVNFSTSNDVKPSDNSVKLSEKKNFLPRTKFNFSNEVVKAAVRTQTNDWKMTSYLKFFNPAKASAQVHGSEDCRKYWNVSPTVLMSTLATVETRACLFHPQLNFNEFNKSSKRIVTI